MDGGWWVVDDGLLMDVWGGGQDDSGRPGAAVFMCPGRLFCWVVGDPPHTQSGSQNTQSWLAELGGGTELCCRVELPGFGKERVAGGTSRRGTHARFHLRGDWTLDRIGWRIAVAGARAAKLHTHARAMNMCECEREKSPVSTRLESFGRAMTCEALGERSTEDERNVQGSKVLTSWNSRSN